MQPFQKMACNRGTVEHPHWRWWQYSWRRTCRRWGNLTSNPPVSKSQFFSGGRGHVLDRGGGGIKLDANLFMVNLMGFHLKSAIVWVGNLMILLEIMILYAIYPSPSMVNFNHGTAMKNPREHWCSCKNHVQIIWGYRNLTFRHIHFNLWSVWFCKMPPFTTPKNYIVKDSSLHAGI